jgi:hypothetical protein
MVDKLEYLKRIERCEEKLKERERNKWSPSERQTIKEHGETKADYFQIIYKLSVLERMRSYLEKYGNLPHSFKKMLKNPFGEW